MGQSPLADMVGKKGEDPSSGLSISSGLQTCLTMPAIGAAGSRSECFQDKKLLLLKSGESETLASSSNKALALEWRWD